MNSYNLSQLIATTAGLVFYTATLPAQTKYGSEFGISAGAGNSTPSYSLFQNAETRQATGTGGSLGASYTKYFSRYAGLSVGLEAGIYKNSFRLDAIHKEYPVATPPGLQGSFSLRMDHSGLEGKHTAIFLHIPVMLQFQAPLAGSTFLYFGAGGKAGIVSQSLNHSIQSLTTTGYSPYTAQTYEDMPSHGFDTYSGVKANVTFKNSPVFIASLESGLKFAATGKTPVYIGAYLDYAINNTPKASGSLKYNTSNPGDHSYLDAMGDPFSINNKKPFVGIKIKVSFRINQKNKEIKDKGKG
ncbi:MAG: hypothetical protein LBU44_04520 [Mediterranea sp.]|jgi:hypothetical protein|nr:hypothetical protein [Mediterranea sp.]